ncbi:MAG: hypothetical protein L6V93_07110 [Clostridiales bacterium]|nr:MAG: hypothetical protein L6V93_07110 [Clostridiales bacterium]
MRAQRVRAKETMAKYFFRRTFCAKAIRRALSATRAKTLYAGTNPNVITISNDDKAEIGAAKKSANLSPMFLYVRRAPKKKNFFIIKKRASDE